MHEGRIICKANTQELLGRSVHISGSANEVDAACMGLDVYHVEKMGRSKGATIVLRDGQELPGGFDVTYQPISLQELFLALCGGEETA